jgi:DNA repair protein RadC
MANNFKSFSPEVKPRERMEMLGCARGMRPDELLAILLKTGASGCDVGETSRRMISAFHDVGEMVRCDWKGLLAKIAAYNKSNPEHRILGVGKVKCMELAAAFELVRIAYETTQDADLPKEIGEGTDAAAWFRSQLRYGDDREHFFVLPLDAAHKPLSKPVRISSGLLTGVSASAREVFAEAVQWQAAAIIVAHNHPSGDPSPSNKDISLTKELLAASKVLRIPLLDHIILGRGNSFTPLRENSPDLGW